MTSPAAILAPLLLLFGPPAPIGSGGGEMLPVEEQTADGVGVRPGWIMLEAVYAEPVQRQVRIEQRVIIRISPRSATARQNMSSLAALPPRDRIVEREIECLPVAAIGAVQPSRDNRLTLFMRDRRLFSVELERSCSARDFYSGFYVEQKSDGMMCADRDRLQSRTGSRCEIEGLKQMVVERD
jgi:hypothetical protein